MNGAPRMAPIPISSPVSWPDRIATSGSSVSGSAVPTAASTDPTAPSESPNPSPIHSMPFVNSSAPARITRSDAASRAQTIGGFSHRSATVNVRRGVVRLGSRRHHGRASRPGDPPPTRGRDLRLQGWRNTVSLVDDPTDIHPSRQRLAMSLAIAAYRAGPDASGPRRPTCRTRWRRRCSVWRSSGRRSSCRGQRRSRSWTSPPAWRSPCWRSSRCCRSTRSTSSSPGKAGTRSRRPGRRACRRPAAGRSLRAGSRSRT